MDWILTQAQPNKLDKALKTIPLNKKQHESTTYNNIPQIPRVNLNAWWFSAAAIQLTPGPFRTSEDWTTRGMWPCGSKRFVFHGARGIHHHSSPYGWDLHLELQGPIVGAQNLVSDVTMLCLC